MNRAGRLAALCVAIVLASAAATYAYLSLKAAHNLERARKELDQADPNAASLPPEGLEASLRDLSSDSKVSSSTEVVYRIMYECGHDEVNRMAAPPEMFGLTREELSLEVPEWTVTEFTKERVVLSQRRAGMSPECVSSMHIGEKDGWVTVFYGAPKRRCRPKSVTRIRASDLPQSERADLQDGIPVSGEEDLLRILETLASWADG
ncbi:MAG: BofC C-terminal domain-containing protein [Firmicutes bacterium]|nr:BofC C-terminal domain-containing protein [Bacillota bacterium]MDH7496099.1 BofC C-terminal domain-containing protein [Bacillota bacterium]